MRQAGDPASDLSLPNLTGFLATDAKTLGGFGLVGPPITIAYHLINLGQTSGQNTITKHYHRGEHITHSGRDYVLCWVITIV